MKIDPKPNLSARAIASNIEYYRSICHKYRAGYKDAKKELDKWTQRLNEISNTTGR